MKKLLIVILLLIGFKTLGQTKYNITLNTSDNLKDVIADFTNNIETFNRYVLDSNLITFSSYQHLSDGYFHNLSYDGRHVISINRENVGFTTPKTSPGGTDCEDASLVCSNDSFDGTATNFGTQELNGTNSGCLGLENQSSWYYINVGTGGTLEMTINPTNGNDDYDWAIWGPFTPANAAANCPPTSAPVKCSFSACTTPTGMGNGLGCTCFLIIFCSDGPVTGTGNSEGAGGDSWVAPLNVTAGQIYIMLIDNFSASGDPYNLTWGGTATLDCTPVVLPIELISFEGKNIGNSNLLEWSTASEINNDYYIISTSTDGITWNSLANVSGAGNSSQTLSYRFIHNEPKDTINYYKLTQVDYDGVSETFDVIVIDNRIEPKVLIKVVNFMGQTVTNTEKGLFIEIYSDGTTRKISRD